jgi:5-methylcytosine-specific restriction endonuclease McrA
MCKLHRCTSCAELFPKGDMKADHILPVIDPVEGFVGWDSYISRMFCEADGWQALCGPCHDRKTAAERAVRDGALKIVCAPRSRQTKEKG